MRYQSTTIFENTHFDLMRHEKCPKIYTHTPIYKKPDAELSNMVSRSI